MTDLLPSREGRFARFDDSRPGRKRTFVIGPFEYVITAHRPEEVPEALTEVEAAVKKGLWVAGWVSYESAPGLDPAFEVKTTRHTRYARLPLVWFGVAKQPTVGPSQPASTHRLGDWTASVTQHQHSVALEEIRKRIRAGDTYQVNHTFQLSTGFSGDPVSLYERLIAAQSPGYGALVNGGDWVVASASPELFFHWHKGVLKCRPMKGTASRGLAVEEDEAARIWLEKSEKNRAENVMVVDMVRNDLARVAEAGSVKVPDLFTIEKYDTVWQMTSTVVARPRRDTTLREVFAALFPSASITGAPKVSTMTIISQLEDHPRGVYCGAVGYGAPGPDGPEFKFNVAIRTVVIDTRAGIATYGTGGGITYESTPASEYQEALLKTAILSQPPKHLKLIETTLWDPLAGARHLDPHLQRAKNSADYFDIPFEVSRARSAVDRAVRHRTTAALLRLRIDLDGSTTIELEDPPEPTDTILLAIDDRPVDRTDRFLYHKTSVRHTYEAAAARHPNTDDVILWNQDKEVTETTIGNLAVKLDGEWLTPPVSSGLLAGTERAALLESGSITEGVVTVEDLHRASALARINSVRGWEDAELVDP